MIKTYSSVIIDTLLETRAGHSVDRIDENLHDLIVGTGLDGEWLHAGLHIFTHFNECMEKLCVNIAASMQVSNHEVFITEDRLCLC